MKIKCYDVCNKCRSGFINCDMKCEQCELGEKDIKNGNVFYHCKCHDVKQNTPCAFFPEDGEES